MRLRWLMLVLVGVVVCAAGLFGCSGEAGQPAQVDRPVPASGSGGRSAPTSAAEDAAAPSVTLPFALRPVMEAAPSEPVLLLPESTNVAVEVTRAMLSGPRTEPEPPASVVLLGVPTTDGLRDLVGVVITEADADREVSESELKGVKIVEIGGAQARLSNFFSRTSLDWFTDGHSMAVIGPRDRQDLILALGPAVNRDIDLDALLAVMPDTYRVIGSLSYPDPTDPRPAVAPAPDWSVRVDVGATSVSILGAWPPAEFAPLFAFVGAEVVQTVDVRGGQGAWTTRRVSFDSDEVEDLPEFSSTTLVWLETPDLMVTMIGSTDLGTLLAVAESLTIASSDRFSRPS